MNHILQNVKSGFANMTEILGIFLSVNDDSDGYDLYINSKDPELSQTARVLKDSEEKQEAKRFSIFTDKQPKRSTKKNFKSSPSAKGKSSHKKISNDEHIRESIEPEL